MGTWDIEIVEIVTGNIVITEHATLGTSFHQGPLNIFNLI